MSIKKYQCFGMKLKDAIKLYIVKLDKSETNTGKNVLPEDG